MKDLQILGKPYKLLYVIMSHTNFRVNSHSIVCLNVQELLARSRCHIWSLHDSNEIWTHNDSVCKRTLNHLASWLNGWVFVYELSGCGFESCCVTKKLLFLKDFSFRNFCSGSVKLLLNLFRSFFKFVCIFMSMLELSFLYMLASFT